MGQVIKSKKVSYGLIEIRETGIGHARYGIYVNGSLKEYSNDLSFLTNLFNNKYY